MSEKNVPILDSEGADLEDYKIRAHKWCRLTKIKKSDQAETLQLALPKKPFGITKRIHKDVLHSAEGVQALLDKLDEHYIPDKLQHTMAVWEKFMRITRKPSELMINHIQKFMEAFESFQDIDAKIECPDRIVAMMLLASCNLKDEDKKIITAQMEEPPATKNLIGILKRVMTADKTAMETNESESDKTESSDILFAKSSSDRAMTNTTLYTRDRSRPYLRRARSDRNERGNSYERERGIRRNTFRSERNEREDSYERERGPRKNPIGPDGRRRRCMVCDSIWHYVNECPEVKQLKKDYRNKKDDNRDNEKNQEVNLSY